MSRNHRTFGYVQSHALPLVTTMSVVGLFACSANKDPSGESQAKVTYADGSIDDAPKEEIGDGWVVSEAGAATDGATDSSADAGPLCPGQVGGELDTFLGTSNYIQVDIDTAARQAGTVGANANLVLGNDPADGTGSFDLPAALSGSASYIDWDSLSGSLGSHQITDFFKGKDPSSFPGNSSCVGAANNPAKDELLEVGIANNDDYVYLNVLRSSSLGDMGYTWLFTKDKPACSVNGTCDNWLRYHIQAGDVLVFGHFRTGTALLLDVYKAKAGVDTTLDATSAIEWCNVDVWEEDTTSVAAVAVNTDITHAGSWLVDGLKSPQTGADGKPAFEDHIFAEGAVKTSTFGTNGVCGQTFWGSVISKSSGNACSGADVKDLIGPRQVNFGSITAQVAAKANCDGTVNLEASATGATGPISCVWYDGSTQIASSPTCDEVVGVALSEGTHSISVKIADAGDAGTGCAATSPVISVTTHPAPTIGITLTPYCSSTNNLSYGATASGQGTLKIDWTLTNSSSTTGLPQPSGTSGNLTVAPVGPSITYTANAKVTDSRGCTANATPATATPLAPISVSLTPSTVSRACSASAPQTSVDDAVTFTAGAAGGDGAYHYTWTVQTCTNPSDSSTCTSTSCDGDKSTCKIDPLDSDNPDTNSCVSKKISVSVDDGSTLCGASSAGPKTYTKVTQITVE